MRQETHSFASLELDLQVRHFGAREPRRCRHFGLDEGTGRESLVVGVDGSLGEPATTGILVSHGITAIGITELFESFGSSI